MKIERGASGVAASNFFGLWSYGDAKGVRDRGVFVGIWWWSWWDWCAPTNGFIRVNLYKHTEILDSCKGAPETSMGVVSAGASGAPAV